MHMQLNVQKLEAYLIGLHGAATSELDFLMSGRYHTKLK